MAKKSSTPKEPIEVDEKMYVINSGTLKDNFCNYGYEIGSGPTKGDVIPTRKGTLLIHDDLRAAMKKLHPHLAVICEEIDHNKIKDIEAIEDYDPDLHKETSLEYKISMFSVNSFVITGTGENEGVSILGSKMLSTGEYVKLTSPVKAWSSSYHFINELRVAVDDLVFEIEEYMNGKSQPKMVQAELEMPDGDEEFLGR